MCRELNFSTSYCFFLYLLFYKCFNFMFEVFFLHLFHEISQQTIENRHILLRTE